MPSLRLLTVGTAGGPAHRVGPSETETTKQQYYSHFCNVGAAGPGVCLAGFLCFPCLKAQTLHDIDGSDRLFSVCCVSQVMARNYVNAAYHLRANQPGWQCLGATFLPCCATIQQYAHVHKGAPRPELPPLNDKYKTTKQQRLGCSNRGSVCEDPMNFLGHAIFSWSESAMLASALLGTPFWVSYCCSNYCATHHFFRKNYGVPGSDVYEDCVEPCLCCCCCCTSSLVCPECCCLVSMGPASYFAQQRHNERAVIREAGKTSPQFLPETQTVEYTSLFEAINPIITDEPQFTDVAL